MRRVIAIVLVLGGCGPGDPLPDASRRDAATPDDASGRDAAIIEDASGRDAAIVEDASGRDAAIVEDASGRDAAIVEDARAAEVVLEISDRDFGTVTVGSSQEAESTVRNAGTIASGPIDARIEGPFASAFAVVGSTCDAGLAPGDTCAVRVRFTPTMSGTSDATLVVSSGDASAMGALFGLGVYSEPPLFEPSVRDFGEVAIDTSSPTFRFTLRNIGGGPASISSVSIAGTNPLDFQIATDGCTGVLPAAATCEVDVVFTPRASGARAGVLRMFSDAGSTAAALVGTGI